MSGKKNSKRQNVIIRKRLATGLAHDGVLEDIEAKNENPSTSIDVLPQENEILQTTTYYVQTDVGNDEIVTTESNEQQDVSTNQNVTAIDLMNFKLVRFDDGDGEMGAHYRLVPNSDQQIVTTINGEEVLLVTSSEAIDIEHVNGSDRGDDMVNSDGSSTVQETKYQLQVDSDNGSLMMLACDNSESPAAETATITKQIKPFQQKQFIKNNVASNIANTVGGRRTLPPARELLSSPNFKLFLYSCKQCEFQCNAIKDLTIHKAEKHAITARNRNSSSSWSAMRNTTANRKVVITPYPVKTNTEEKLQ